jgi:hypothetical protein
MFVAVQGMNTLMCKQQSQLSKLVSDMQKRASIEGPMTAQDHACLFPTMPEERALVSEFIYNNLHYVTRVKTAEGIEEAEMTVQMELDQIKEANGTETGSPYHAVLKTVASFALMVVDRVSKIVAEQHVLVDNGGILVLDEIPPVLPVELCGMTPRYFSRALQNQMVLLLAKDSVDDVEDIDAQFRPLRIA